MLAWDPILYLKFEQERTQPVKDLISRIEADNPKRIIDIGCGPGNSTIELKNRWEDAYIVGLDCSESMLMKAKEDYPDLTWIVGDARNDISALGKFDIVFSNAAIQWIPDHKGLLSSLFSIISDNGILAVQVPNASYMPINIAVHQTAKEERWQKYFHSKKESLNMLEIHNYYDILSPLAIKLDMWETHYYHIMPGHEAIIEWYRSTGMRPYLERLNEYDEKDFLNSVMLKVQKEYPVQEDGKVLFPFRRLFLIAYKV